ncbi:cytochrome P450 [Actinokineospora sp. G85]|uniref:cytochrome P450 n=1 Tax=Actinokineospora sp. G85 TaxID=3406626 RepID=UPI003C716807
MVKFATVMAAAATLTTVDAIGNTLLLLCEAPGLRAQVLADPSLVDSLVEESVRWESPVANTSRVLAEPVCLGQVPLAAGDRVVMAWGSANRDRAVFADGDVPRLDRDHGLHLGWGRGPHECPGRHLARVALAVVVEEVLAAVPDYEVVGPLPTRGYGALRGPLALPVEWSVQDSPEGSA